MNKCGDPCGDCKPKCEKIVCEQKETKEKCNCQKCQKLRYEIICKKEECTEKCKQSHVHEIVGSTMISGCCRHNHRFATVSGPAIKTCENHVHEIKFRTDYAGHYHEFKGMSSPAIKLCDGKHTHFANACTSTEDCHKHEFKVASLIENPLDIKE
ncbi:MAG: YmaF family protein [Firmicutes bacterium]|nr:YmaF family protein [Bacillota bacterium]